MTATESNPSHHWLDTPFGYRLAYHHVAGQKPGIIFLSGFMSDMAGTKAVALEEYCRLHNHAYVRFDYSGHGLSEGNFTDGSVKTWLADAVHVFDNLTEGAQIVVGSSMGGWLGMHLTLMRANRVRAFVGLAPAPDFTEDLFHAEMNDAQRAELWSTGRTTMPSCYDMDYVITQKMMEDGKALCMMDDVIPITQPVRIIQGMRDIPVPWEKAIRIADTLLSTDVNVTLIKDGDHSLSRASDIQVLKGVLAPLLAG